ncbi:hypothetical protein BDN72DRAFT_898674 [Pluteus cervinus]|uniref:Uncharacterized protein n=1 Tax=Pluteus cervinus TaxID=181527 RepID=A0ACD3APW9_9AGAR|nr:hypothetical protein BDN72DRAFT_898674 [Pluteus cervinus]
MQCTMRPRPRNRGPQLALNRRCPTSIPSCSHPTTILSCSKLSNTTLTLSPPSKYEDEKQTNSLPFDFYDRHLSSELALKRVVIQPSLTQALTKILDFTLEDLDSRGMVPLALTNDTVGDLVSPTFAKHIYANATAARLASRYEFTLGDAAPPYISRWLLHPTAPKFYSALAFGDRGSNFSKHQEEYVFSSSLHFRPFEYQRPEVLSLVSDQIKDALRSIASGALITYQFFPMSAAMDELFKDMGALEAQSLHAEYRTGGFPEAKAQLRPPCDAKKRTQASN